VKLKFYCGGPAPYWVDRQSVNNKEVNAEYNTVKILMDKI
jgi:hypothetical protein